MKKPTRKIAKPKISEKEIQQQIIHGLELLGYSVYRINNTGIYNQKTGKYFFHGKAGVPDILAINYKRNKLLFIECKSLTGKVSEDQLNFFKIIDGITIVKGCVARSWEDVKTMNPY